VALELHSLVNKYPDVSVDILIALLTVRGDISKSDARAKAQEALANINRDDVSAARMVNSILSQVVLPAGFLAQFL
jgi:exocyst complex component 3